MGFGQTFKMEETVEGFDFYVDETLKTHMILDSDKVSQDLKFLFKTQTEDDAFHPEFGFNFQAIINNSIASVVESEMLKAIIQYKFVTEILYMNVSEIDAINRTVSVDVGLVVDDVVIETTVVI